MSWLVFLRGRVLFPLDPPMRGGRGEWGQGRGAGGGGVGLEPPPFAPSTFKVFGDVALADAGTAQVKPHQATLTFYHRTTCERLPAPTCHHTPRLVIYHKQQHILINNQFRIYVAVQVKKHSWYCTNSELKKHCSMPRI